MNDTVNHIDHERYGRHHPREPVPERIISGAWRGDFVNRYINSEIGICLYFHSWEKSVDMEGGDLALVFQKASLDGLDGFQFRSSRDAHLGASPGNPSTNHMQSPMPVLARPVVKDAKGSIYVKGHEVHWNFWSVVRLYRLNKRPTLLRQWPYLQSRFLKIDGAVANREFQVVLVGGRVLAALNNGGLIDTSVESRSQVIKAFSQFESAGTRKIVRWRDVDAPCPVTLHIYENAKEVFFSKTVPSFGQGFAMRYCPADTVPTAIEW